MEDSARLAMQIVEKGGIGLARKGLPRPFYFKVSRGRSSADNPAERFVEMQFNPEWIVLAGRETDSLVRWGAREEVAAWVAELLEEFDGELCPPNMRTIADTLLFGETSAQVDVNEADPWGFDGLKYLDR